MWLCANKTLFIKSDCGPDTAWGYSFQTSGLDSWACSVLAERNRLSPVLRAQRHLPQGTEYLIGDPAFLSLPPISGVTRW